MATAISEGNTYLDGRRLSRGFLAGIGRVIADQDRLNRINVFPVPDGDTGTNLAVTMGSVRAALMRHRDSHAGKTLEVIADAALDGARGNSGAILAQFFQGLCDACVDARLLTTEHFVAAVSQGARYAREALAEPREGTILTVITDFGRELKSQAAEGAADFGALLDRGLKRARESLAHTTQQLEVLRRAGVVDAGAAGFVDLLQGITDYVKEGRLHPDEAPGDQPHGAAADGEAGAVSGAELADAAHRWCTECLVCGSDIDLKHLRESLAGLGSSLVVAGGRRRARVHIHVDDPETVFRIAADHGTVESRKADDMHMQQRSAARHQGSVAVVTDTAGDLPDELLASLDIHQVPVRIHLGKKSYLDKVGITPEEFYRLMSESPDPPKTSQPPPGDFRRLYQILGSHHSGVLSIHVTAWGSGTFQAAESAAGRARSASPVKTVDSRNASLGQGLVVLAAAELAAAGLGLDEITRRLDRIIAGTRVWGLLGSIDHAVAGGRVSAAKGRLVRALRLAPILTNFPDGRLGLGGALAGRRHLVRRFARFVARRAPSDVPLRIAVGHANAPAAAAELLAALEQRLTNITQSFVTEIGTALGVHGGPGTLVVAMQPAPLADPELAEA
ncbi:MAG: DegV family protein [Gammaproteobacteria bacterium]